MMKIDNLKLILETIEKQKQPIKAREVSSLLKEKSGDRKFITHREIMEVLFLLKTNQYMISGIQLFEDGDDYLIIPPKAKKVEEERLL